MRETLGSTLGDVAPAFAAATRITCPNGVLVYSMHRDMLFGYAQCRNAYAGQGQVAELRWHRDVCVRSGYYVKPMPIQHALYL